MMQAGQRGPKLVWYTERGCMNQYGLVWKSFRIFYIAKRCLRPNISFIILVLKLFIKILISSHHVWCFFLILYIQISIVKFVCVWLHLFDFIVTHSCTHIYKVLSVNFSRTNQNINLSISLFVSSVRFLKVNKLRYW